ncbi:DUF4301 family protein [Ekhidna sp.]
MNTNDLFSEKDLNQIRAKGIEARVVLNQLSRFKSGFSPLNITAPATIDSGIVKLNPEKLTSYIELYEQSSLDIVKFVPASGAASRMFKNLFAFTEDGSQKTSDPIVALFCSRIKDFAFFDELSIKVEEVLGKTLKDLIEIDDYQAIVETLLKSEGLNYGKMPKGLLSFHNYEDFVRTPAQEHLSEGKAYASKNGSLNIHFTVSPDHRNAFENHLRKEVEKESDLNISIQFSEQSQSTDTIASTTTFDPFRIMDGQLLFRPAGHGALLQNLNMLSEDIVFIKNIDNVVSEKNRTDEIQYKKALAGVLIDYQRRAFEILTANDKGDFNEANATELLLEMGVRGEFDRNNILSLLNRPIRVCGMVKNEGEPGGGPFWVNSNGIDSLQIVESAQVDTSNQQQLEIFRGGTHFNPVDIVCGIKNYKGEKFDLMQFQDEEAGFISEKSYGGEKLLAMELPGLWNGSMANWNTIFVEVPSNTFNPVKTVVDLLKPAHN